MIRASDQASLASLAVILAFNEVIRALPTLIRASAAGDPWITRSHHALTAGRCLATNV